MKRESNFDPYYRWLGIPPDQQPPNHYRLLGIELFESNPDVIQSAAERQVVYIDTFKIGPQSDLSQQLLNEIARAKVCLCNPDRKRAYDRMLQARGSTRAQLGVPHRSDGVRQPETPNSTAIPVPCDTTVVVDPNIPLHHSNYLTARKPRRLTTWLSVSIALGVLAFGVIALLVSSPGPQKSPFPAVRSSGLATSSKSTDIQRPTTSVHKKWNAKSVGETGTRTASEKSQNSKYSVPTRGEQEAAQRAIRAERAMTSSEYLAEGDKCEQSGKKYSLYVMSVDAAVAERNPVSAERAAARLITQFDVDPASIRADVQHKLSLIASSEFLGAINGATVDEPAVNLSLGNARQALLAFDSEDAIRRHWNIDGRWQIENQSLKLFHGSKIVLRDQLSETFDFDLDLVVKQEGGQTNPHNYLILTSCGEEIKLSLADCSRVQIRSDGKMLEAIVNNQVQQGRRIQIKSANLSTPRSLEFKVVSLASGEGWHPEVWLLNGEFRNESANSRQPVNGAAAFRTQKKPPVASRLNITSGNGSLETLKFDTEESVAKHWEVGGRWQIVNRSLELQKDSSLVLKDQLGKQFDLTVSFDVQQKLGQDNPHNQLVVLVCGEEIATSLADCRRIQISSDGEALDIVTNDQVDRARHVQIKLSNRVKAPTLELKVRALASNEEWYPVLQVKEARLRTGLPAMP